MINKCNYIVEEMADLTTNIEENPYASRFKNEMLRYSSNNILLDNGQMIYIDLPQTILKKIDNYNMEIFINILRSEKIIVECQKIINDYKINNKNKSNTYIKNCYEIIINMDQVSKYTWYICKLLNDGLGDYNKYVKWQKDKIDIDERIYDEWDRIYQIRNYLAHPEVLLSPTFLRRVDEKNVIRPILSWKGEKYDLLDLAKQSIQIQFILSRLIIGASFLYSKYTKIVIDKN